MLIELFVFSLIGSTCPVFLDKKTLKDRPKSAGDYVFKFRLILGYSGDCFLCRNTSKQYGICRNTTLFFGVRSDRVCVFSTKV